VEHLDKIKKLLLKELEEFAARDKIEGFEDLEVIHKITDTVKNICKIEMLHKQGGDGGYSGGNYGGGYSYTGEGGSGGYSSRGGNGGYSMRGRDWRGRYTRDDGRDQMVNELENLMGHLGNSEDRETLKRLMDHLRNS
jgi:hypothetical protein